ncbi:MAG: phosphomethylpyrimidine synthase ThiC, partial [Candidatus Aminicenantales bacterium]
MTQLEQARKCTITKAMRTAAADEGIRPDGLLPLVASGKVVIPFNPNHSPARPCAIGRSLRTKVNVNIGTSADFPSLADELRKVDVAVKY